MRRSTLIKLGVIALLLLLFVGYTVYLKWDRTDFTVDSKTFEIKESYGEVMAEDVEQIDGLRLADEFDKTEDVDITREMPNKQRNLKIHDVWLTPNQFYVLYSVNLQKKDEVPADILELNFSEVTLDAENHDTITLPTTRYDRQEMEYDESDEDEEGDEDDEGVVFDKRLYRSLVMEPDYEELEEDDIPNIEELFTETTHIALKAASLKMDDDDEQTIDDLVVEAAYNEDNQTLFTMPLEEDVQLENGHVLTLEELSVAPFVNTLYFSVESDAPMQGIEAEFTWDSRESPEYTTQYGVIEDEDYSTVFMPFEAVPEQLDIDVKSVIYVNDETVSLRVPADLEQKDVSQEVGKVKGTTFYFEGYEPSEFGHDSRMRLKLKWDSNMEAESDYSSPILNDDLEMQYEGIEDEERKKEFIDLHSDILTVENEKGEKPVFGPTDSGQPNLLMTEETSAIYLEKSFVEESEDIHITIEKFTFSENVEDGTVHIDIPDDYVSDDGK